MTDADQAARVRYAHRSDINRIVELARIEHTGSTWGERGLPFSPVAVADTVASFIETPGRTVFVTDGGYFMGLVQPLGFSGAFAAMEYAWFAEDGSGFALLHTFDRWAQRMGAVQLIVHDMAGRDQRLAAVLSRRYGFTPMGVALTRRPGIKGG